MTDEEYLKLKVTEIDWKSLSEEEIDRVLALRVDAYERRIADCGGRRPGREGYVVERLALMSTLRLADAEAQKGKLRQNRGIRRHNERAEKDLRKLQMMILTLSFPECRYETMFRLTDGGKTREIAKQRYFPWRILHHDIMLVIGERLYSSLIMDTFACIKGKGLHFGVQRIKRFLRLNPEYRWYWKTDFKKYYQSIPHEVISRGLRNMVKDAAFIRLVEITLFSYGCTSEIEDLLEQEAARKERCADWCLYKPASRQFQHYRNRPPHEGSPARERILSVQRRHDRLRTDKGRGETAAARVHPSYGIRVRTGCKDECGARSFSEKK